MVGLDKNEKAIAEAREKNPEARFGILDISKEDIPEKFDVIFMKFFLGALHGVGYPSRGALWDGVMKKVKNSCDCCVIINPLPKAGKDQDEVRQIFVPEKTLSEIMQKYFGKIEKIVRLV